MIFKGFSLMELGISVAIFVVVLFIAKFISIRLKRLFKDKLNKTQLSFILKFSYYGIILLYIFSILTFFGVNFSGLMVAGGIAGIVLGFASQRIVGNLISGLFLFVERPVSIGSDVNIEGFGGFVEDIKVLSTIIRTYDGLYVRIPNEKVFLSNIVNNVVHCARRVEYVIGIDYTSNVELAIKVLKATADNHPLVLVNPAPEIFVLKLAESSIDIEIRLWAPTTHWWAMKKDSLLLMKKALDEAGIVIPFPQQVMWMGEKQ